MFGIEDYFKQKMESDPDYKSYLDGSYYKKLSIKKEENRKKEGDIEANYEDEN